MRRPMRPASLRFPIPVLPRRTGRRSQCLRIGCTLLLTVAGCASQHSNESVLDPAGPQGDRIAKLFWVFTGVGVFVWCAVILFLVLALWRRRSRETTPILQPAASRERRIGLIVTGSVVLTIAILFALLVGEFTTARAMHRFAGDPNAVSIKITAQQWWWEATYQDATPVNVFTTANELHIPVGRPMRFELNSQDVIHSFWVPNLHGKKDCVPGHPTEIWLQADRPGEYWGECAEFCGFEHAQMRLLIVAQPQAEFDAWLTAQRSPPPPPMTEAEIRGQHVFQSNNCVFCHQLSGSWAFGRVGPDLSHVGSKQMLAAGAVGRGPNQLAAWITHPQRIKPGTRMPDFALSHQDLNDLVAFLESRK